MIVEGFIKRNERRDLTGDPWDGRTLEWAVSSPPPHYNFAVIPQVSDRDAFWEMKKSGDRFKPKVYHDIHLPKNSPAGLLIGFFNLLLGFGLIWHIWWMAIVGFVGFIVVIIVRTSSDNIYYYLPAEEARRRDEEHLAKLKLAAASQPAGTTQPNKAE